MECLTLLFPAAGGLSAVVQELSMGKFDDPENCTSYLKVSRCGGGSRRRQTLVKRVENRFDPDSRPRQAPKATRLWVPYTENSASH